MIRQVSFIAASTLAVATALGSPALAQSGAVAQTGATAPAAGQDIIVTALRRNERLQEAPAAISVVTGETLSVAGIKDTHDLSKVVAPLRFEGGVRPGVPNISLRGIAAVQGGDAPVSIVVDGVQIPFLSLAAQDLIDVSSVELLRGPQGALYGRGAIAGALVINTEQPTDDVRGSIEGTAQRGNDYRGVATLSGPLIPGKLRAKATVSYQNSDGNLYNYTRHEDQDFVDQVIVSGELLFTPTDTTRIALKGAMTRGKLGTNELSQVPIGGGITDFQNYRLVLNYPNNDQRRLYSTSIKIDQDTPIGTLTSVTQYAYAHDRVDADFDYTAAPLRHNLNFILDKGWNEDLRLTSASTGAFTWLVGAFYQNRRGYNDSNFSQDPAATTPQASGISYDHFTSKSLGGYGQATYNFGRGLSLTGGVRYDTDKRYDVLLNAPGSAIRGRFSAWQPSVTAKWQASRELMVYATYGKGFRSGGFNAANLVIPAIGAQRTYPKEISESYELGFKSQLFDRKLTLDVDVFRTDYTDTQFQRSIVTPVAAKFITSVKSARVNGVEADLSLRATSDLTFTGSFVYNGSKIRDFNGTGLYVGNDLPNVYRDTEQLSAEYRPWLTRNLRGLLRIDALRRGRISYDLTQQYVLKDAAFLDARVGVDTDHWSLAVFAENITNKRVPETFVPLAFGAGGAARLENQPVRVGVDVRYHF